MVANAQSKLRFFCKDCNEEIGKYRAVCPKCNGVNTVQSVYLDAVSTPKNPTNRRLTFGLNNPTPITEVESSDIERRSTGIPELDRVLGGGLIDGHYAIIGGAPGTGKSTLLLEMANNMATKESPVLYVSGEEAESQTKIRANRLAINNPHLYIVYDTSLENIMEHHIKKVKPGLLIVDSINTIVSDVIDGIPGSERQMKHVDVQIRQYVKATGMTCFIIGQVTKEGDISGSNKLAHMVDTVIYLDGDDASSYRFLRSAKNRFGSTAEMGVFEMRSDGLKEISDPTGIFLQNRDEEIFGAAMTMAMEGTRPIMAEIQALTTRSSSSSALRSAIGLKRDRMIQNIAVLSKNVQETNLAEFDIHATIAGGITLRDSTLDLPLILAIVSSYWEKPLPVGMVSMGELNLTGELRSGQQMEERLNACWRQGVTTVITPPLSKGIKKPKGLEVIEMKNIRQVIKRLFERELVLAREDEEIQQKILATQMRKELRDVNGELSDIEKEFGHG